MQWLSEPGDEKTDQGHAALSGLSLSIQYFILTTLHVLWQTVKTQMVRHFMSVCTVCQNKTILIQGHKNTMKMVYHDTLPAIYFKILTSLCSCVLLGLKT